MFSWIYYLVSVGALAVLIRQCVANEPLKSSKSWFWSDTAFIGVVFFTLLFMRLPSLFHNAELNPDEGQVVAQAITLAQDPVFGRSVDGTSIGPLNTYLLLIPRLIGLPTDYVAARLMSLVLIALSLLFFYRSLRQLTTSLVSRLSTVIVLIFFAWATENDYLHYSSELSSLLIITSCFYLSTRIFHSSGKSTTLVLILGLVAGLTPYCKLQTLPIVGVLLLIVTLYIIRTTPKNAFGLVTRLGVAFLLPTGVVFSLAYGFNVEHYFIDYYFIGNLTTYGQIYANVPLTHRGILVKLLRFPGFSIHHADFFIFILTNSVAVLTTTFAVGWSLRKRSWRLPMSFWPALLIVATALSSLLAVVAPGTEFGHHLLLLVFPLGWVTGLCLQFLVDNLSVRLQSRLAVIAVGLLIADIVLSNHFLLPSIKHSARQLSHQSPALSDPTDPTSLQVRNPLLASFPAKTRLAPSLVAQVIKPYISRSDKMAVWGWNCQYYIESQLAQGVSENHTQRSIIPNRMRDQYLNRYSRELQKNKPTVFIDAVGPASLILRESSQQHEQFALINHIIQNQYSLVASVDHVRIYVRRDRLMSHRLLRTAKFSATL